MGRATSKGNGAKSKMKQLFQICPCWDTNTGVSDLCSNTLPLDQRGAQLYYLEMVHNYKYLGINIDSPLTFTRHVAGTKRKVDVRCNIIKAITNMKIGVNIKMFRTIYKSLKQYVILYAAPVILLTCDSALQSLERIQRIWLRYMLGLTNEASSILVYKESGIVPIRLLIIKGNNQIKFQPNQNYIVHRVQEKIHRYLRVYNDTLWSIKATWIKKDIGIPPITLQSPMSQLHS